jgi:hypothetical protein
VKQGVTPHEYTQINTSQTSPEDQTYLWVILVLDNVQRVLRALQQDATMSEESEN